MSAGMNEAETRMNYIDPDLRSSTWGVNTQTRIRPEFTITPGQIEGHGRRGHPQSADYVLEYNNRKLAVVEAKRWDLGLTDGVQQAKDYANMLDVRFTYSSNGQGFYEIDMLTGEERELERDAFPTPEQLWERTFDAPDELRDSFATVPFEDRGGTWSPRYYQDNAIERALQAISDGKDRILLTLATGTGKTSIAFQISWKLFQTRWNRRGNERRPRILFLADRNILANQAFNSFSAFPEDALCRIRPSEIRKSGRVPMNASVFFTIFQTFMSGDEDDESGEKEFFFGAYPEDFFDLIIVDECHRGGANDESTWRGILEHFSPAVQIGLTATPKRTNNVDTYDYFGEPVYEYSLKQGINDGFLTPFRVKQWSTTIDDYSYSPEDTIVSGEIDETREYTEKDFSNRVIEIKARMQKRVELFLNDIDPMEKTLVFCSTQIHAAAVRDLINQIKTVRDVNYCVRVTADDGERGEQHLRDFQDNEKVIPTILTTSKKLSTGVDALNVRNIVLLREVKSMIEFKQIIGRGTRLYEGKYYFTIHDFVNAHKMFNDPDWDGTPADPPPPSDPRPGGAPPPGPRPERPETIVVQLPGGKVRKIQSMVQTTFWGPDGRPMSSSEFLEHLFGQLPDLFSDENELRELWSNPDTRRKLLDKLAEVDILEEHLEEMKRLIEAPNSDVYDVLSYVAFDTPTMTREERALLAAESLIDDFASEEQDFIQFVLDQYVLEGESELDPSKLRDLLTLKYTSVQDALPVFGGQPERIREVFVGFQQLLYAA